MKSKINILSTLIITLGFLGIGSKAIAATGTLTVNATIIQNLTITENQLLNFGSFAIDGASAGSTIIMSNAGTRSESGGIDLITSASGQQGEITIAGETGSSVSFSFPTGVTTLSETGGDTMTIASASWTSSQSSPCTIGTNCANIGIGATLTTTEVNQNPGLYSGTATITATYD